MKKVLVLLALIPMMVNAQSLIGGKNIIKANLSSLAFGNYHVTYERSFLKKMSLSVSYRTMSKRAIPLENITSNFINDPSINLGRFELGNTAITPELRLYLGIGKMRGFYIAPYARFATFDFTVPVKYTTPTTPQTPNGSNDADFVGKIKSTSGGLMFGVQHQIFKKLVFDFWILGGHYGSSNGDLVATFPNAPNGQLSQSERNSLQSAINNLNLDPFKIKGTVATDGKSATITSEGPWAGVRALGISLGFRF